MGGSDWHLGRSEPDIGAAEVGYSQRAAHVRVFEGSKQKKREEYYQKVDGRSRSDIDIHPKTVKRAMAIARGARGEMWQSCKRDEKATTAKERWVSGQGGHGAPHENPH